MAHLNGLDEDRVEKALKYLAETDSKHAIAKAEMDSAEEYLKSVKGLCFLQASGTVAEREARAVSDPDYTTAISTWTDLVKKFKTLDNKRQTEIRMIEVWQTLSANRRKGNV